MPLLLSILVALSLADSSAMQTADTVCSDAADSVAGFSIGVCCPVSSDTSDLQEPVPPEVISGSLQDAFKSGNIIAAQCPDLAGSINESVNAWGSVLANDILIVISAILFLLVISSFLNIFPHLLKCLGLIRENLRIEDNLRLTQDRNRVAAALALPFCLILSRYGIVRMKFMDGPGPEWESLLVIGVFISYIIVRHLALAMKWWLRVNHEAYANANHSIRNHFILLTTAMGLTVAADSVFGIGNVLIYRVLIVEAGIMFLFFLNAKREILSQSCSHFATILYLCTLELIPIILLVTALLLWR